MPDASLLNFRSYSMAAAALTLASAPLLAQVAPAALKVAEAEIAVDTPLDAKARGEHGAVVLEGDISNGRTANLQIATSSRSKSLDDFALLRFSDKPIAAELLEGGATRIRIKAEFYNDNSLDFGVGYSCGQAVLDADWYARAFPERPNEQGPLYSLVQFTGSLEVSKHLKFARDPDHFARVWMMAVEACRSQPAAGFLATLAELGNKRR